MTTPVFVTGANGFIGSRVVRLLVESGRAVRALVRPAGRLERIMNLNCERVTGDIGSRDSLPRAMEGCGSIIHLAGIVRPDLVNSPGAHESHVEGTRHVLDAAVKNGISRMIYVSSIAAVGGTAQPFVHDESHVTSRALQDQLVYARAKVAAEGLCGEYNRRGMSITIVNPAEVFGPDDNDHITCGSLINFAKSNPVFVCKGGVSIVHVDDVAAGIVTALDRGRAGERYLLSGENLTVRQMADLTLDLLKSNKIVINLPRPVIRSLARIGIALRLPLPFDPEIVPFATSYWFMDNSKARRELGIGFRGARQTLDPTLQWLQTTGRIKQGK